MHKFLSFIEFFRFLNSIVTFETFCRIYFDINGMEKDETVTRTSVVTTLMKGKMARTFVAEEASCKHSARNPSLEGWALRCNLLQTKTRSLQEGRG